MATVLIIDVRIPMGSRLSQSMSYPMVFENDVNDYFLAEVAEKLETWYGEGTVEIKKLGEEK